MHNDSMTTIQCQKKTQQATQISQKPNDRAMGTPLKLGVREFWKG